MSPLTIFYNGSCPICAREIVAYQRLASRHGGLGLTWIDINREAAALGDVALTLDQAAKRLHVRPEGGPLYSGVEAFALLWDRLPGFAWLARATRLPIARQAAYAVYEGLLAPLLFWMHRRRQARRA